MRTTLFSLGLLLLVLNGFSQQVARSLTFDNTFVGFYEYKPTNYNDEKNKKYPLIIFLHGIGERGNGTSELPYLLSQGIPKNINEGKTMTFTVNGKTETFLVLSPQLPKWLGAWDNKYVDAMLEYAKKNLRIDEKRIFLTGLSLGGGGVWQYVTTSLKNAKQFAAIAPICGVCYYDLKQMQPTIGQAQIGVWGFANMDDNIVSPWCTISAMDELDKLKSKKIKRTINQWGGHDAWTAAYDVGHSIHSPNLYEWFLSEADNDDDDDDDDKSESNLPRNASPVAKAGNDVTITLPNNSVTLNNAGSYDADGSIKAWNWSKVSGPGTFNIASANNSSTVVNNLVAGTYVFRLTIVDNLDASATDEVTVTVNAAANAAPVAKAGNDISITLPNNNVTLNNAGSFDGDGDIKGWNWTKISGPSQFTIASANSASTAVNNLVEGSYVFRLTVTDNDNATATDDIAVTVHRAKNVAPVAKAGNDISITLPTNAATLSNAGSYDSDGNINGYNWSKVSGPSSFSLVSANAASTDVKNLEAGSYVFRLTVTDNDGETAIDDITVNVNRAANVAPVAKAGNDVSITLPTNSVTLSNAGSYDSDGSIKLYKWSQTAGPSTAHIASASSTATVVTSLVTGNYTFRLTVTDDEGSTASDDVTVQVNRASNVAPVAKTSGDINLTLPANSATLSNAGSYDPDGKIASYKWWQVSGPSTAHIAEFTSASTAVNSLVAGSYTFRLTITDDDGATASDDIIVNVNRSSNVAPVAKAGNDINILLPASSATLNNAGSYDPDGSIKSYKWWQVSGPSTAHISSISTPSTPISLLLSGTYTFRLTVTDDDGATASDDVVVNVTSSVGIAKGPVANAGKDESIPLGQATVLHGEYSVSEGSFIKSYVWTKISGPSRFEILTPSSATTWIRNMEQGTYVYRLTVTDNNGSVDTDDVNIIVNGTMPVANAGKDETIPVGQATVLRGDASYVPGGSIRSYAWTKVSGPSSFEIMDPDGKNTWIRNMTAGVYVYRLTIKDQFGFEGVDDVTITVNGGNSIVANAGKDETIPPGQATVLRGENSYVSGGSIRSYAWTKYAGPNKFEIMSPDSKNSWVRYMDPGTYIFRLTITDNRGAVAYDDVTITVDARLSVARYGNGANGQELTALENTAGTLSVYQKLTVYPNPVVNALNIRWSGDHKGNATLNIVDAGGRVVKTMTVKKENQDFNTSMEVSALVPGVYTIQVQMPGGKPIHKQFLKR
jgi:hypothetical protein